MVRKGIEIIYSWSFSRLVFWQHMIQVGQNRPLMHDFIKLVNKKHQAGDSAASICFLIALNQIGESEEIKITVTGKI